MIDKLTALIREYKGDDSIVIDENTNLQLDLGLDSLDLVNLSCEVEDEFDIEIPDRDIKGLRTVGDVIAVIESL